VVTGTDDVTRADQRISLAVLLREAAGATARDWVMTEPEGRAVIHLSGIIRLVEAAGHTVEHWRQMTRDRGVGAAGRGARARHPHHLAGLGVAYLT